HDGHAVLQWQQISIAPHRGRPGRDLLARNRAFDRVIVVDDVERSEAHLTDVRRLYGVVGCALPAAHPDDPRHAGARSIRASSCSTTSSPSFLKRAFGS